MSEPVSLLNAASDNSSSSTSVMMVVQSGNKGIGELATNPESNHVSLLIGVVVSATTCVVLVLALISCTYFRKWKYRKRRSQDAAFYMNAGFDDFPQGPQQIPSKKTSQSTVPDPYPPSTNNSAALCTLSDLPPHPAGDLYKTYPTPYQLDPHGYVEQNLFAKSHSPPHHNSSLLRKQEDYTNIPGGLTKDLPSTRQPPTEHVPDGNLNDIMFSNPGAKDFTLEERVKDAVEGTESGYDTIDLKDSRDQNQESFILGNIAALNA